MSVDSDRRAKERKIKEGGASAADEARLAAEYERAGLTALAHLQGLIGRWVYLEGVKLNYRGVLVGLTRGGDGEPTGLLLDPCSRVGEWQDLPTEQYEETMEGVRLIPYGTLCDVGAQQAHWPQKTPPKGARGR